MAVAALLWVALAAWALASPVAAAPDDEYHLAMIYCAAGEAECVSEGAREGGPCFSMKPTVAAGCSDWGTRSLPETDGINQGHYPPFYYWAMSPLVGDSLAKTTVAVRLANVTLAVAMLLASAAFTARSLRRTLLWSWPVAAVPMGVYFVASTNPSAWVIIGFAALWAPLLTHLTGPGGRGAHWSDADDSMRLGRVAFVLFATFIALGGRTEGALFLPLVAAALSVYALPSRLSDMTPATWRKLVLPAALVAMSGLFLLVFARTKAETIGGVGEGNSTYAGWDVVQHTINSFLGTMGMPGVPGSGLGTYDVPVPAVAAVLIVSAYGVSAVAGLSVMYGRKAVSLTLFTATAVSLTAVLWSRESWEYFQPRYFVPLSLAWLGLVLVPRPNGYQPRSQESALTLPAVFAVVAVANSLAMLSTILRFLRGLQPQPSRDPLTQAAPDIDPGALASSPVPSWWWNSMPLDPFSVWVLGSIAFALVLAGTWWLLRDQQQGTPPRPAHAENRPTPAHAIP